MPPDQQPQKANAVIAQQAGAAITQEGMPTSLEGETFVLGTILLDDSKFAQVAAMLGEDDFAAEKHRRIFASMRELHTRGERIDYMTLVNELEKFKHLEHVGGVSYIASLTQGMPRREYVESYAKIVKDKSLLRQLIHTANSIIATCVEDGREVEEILAISEIAVMKVGNSALRSGLESPEETLRRYEGGLDSFLDPSRRPKGLMSPFLQFNEYTNGFRPGQLIILAARPAMGKTAMALNIAAHAAMQRGEEPARTVAVFSLEMSREALLTRMLCTAAKIDQGRFRKGLVGKDDKRMLSKALGDLVKSRLFIDDTANLSIIELGAKCRRLQAEHGLDLVIVDYLQLMASKGKVENRTQEISGFSRGLKLLAKELDVPIIALSQLSRATESPTRKDSRPRLSDLRDSGSIEQDADVVCFIYREEVYRPQDKSLEGLADLIIGKQRNGPTGTIKLVFNKRITEFDNRTRTREEDGEEPAPSQAPVEEDEDF